MIKFRIARSPDLLKNADFSDISGKKITAKYQTIETLINQNQTHKGWSKRWLFLVYCHERAHRTSIAYPATLEQRCLRYARLTNIVSRIRFLVRFCSIVDAFNRARPKGLYTRHDWTPEYQRTVQQECQNQGKLNINFTRVKETNY